MVTSEKAGCGVETAHVNGGRAGGGGAVITGQPPHYALNDKLKRISIIPPSTGVMAGPVHPRPSGSTSRASCVYTL